MAVQRRRAAPAAVRLEPMDPAAIAGAGLVIGAVFLILGLTGVVSRLARALPSSIAAGLQPCLGLLPAGPFLRMIAIQSSSGVASSGVLLSLLTYPRAPV